MCVCNAVDGFVDEFVDLQIKNGNAKRMCSKGGVLNSKFHVVLNGGPHSNFCRATRHIPLVTQKDHEYDAVLHFVTHSHLAACSER